MILETVFGLSIIVNVSLDSRTPTVNQTPPIELSIQRKDAALLPLVQRATDCILRRIAADPRYHDDLRPDEINDLIVDSMVGCERPLRAVVEAHDRMYGRGSGQAFLLGPYLDVLPATIVRQGRLRSQAH